MENEKKLFKKDVRRRERRERTKNENSVRSLVEKISELNEIVPYLVNPIDKNSMKYLSSLYSESIVLIKNITVYMVQEDLCGINKSIDDSVIKAQELIGILKEFKDLNRTRKDNGFIDQESQDKASFLLQSLKKKLNELLALGTSILKNGDTGTDGAHCISMGFFVLGFLFIEIF